MKTRATLFLALLIAIGGGAARADAAVEPAATQAPQPVPRQAAPDPAVQVRDMADRLTALERQLQSQGLLSLLNQISELKAEVARLRGQQEELLHAQQVAEKRVKDLYADLDARLKAQAKAPPAPVMPAPAPAGRGDAAAPVAAQTAKATPAKPSVAAPDPDAEGKAYEAALGLLKEGNYAGATKSFQEFIQAYPSAALTANALYWLGLSQFSQSEFKAASATQQRLLKEHPTSAKVPDAMVNLARIHLQLGEPEASRRWLDKVIAEHPASKAADTARKMQDLAKSAN
jgi:tol-pal system protein YbgF